MARVREISPIYAPCNRQESWPGYKRMEELSLPLLTWTKQSSCPRWCECRGTGSAPCCLLLWVDKLAKTMLGSSPWQLQWGRASRLTNLATTQGQNQDYKVAHPTPTSSMNCWSVWRDQTCRFKSTGSLGQKATVGYPKRVSVRAQHWECSRSQSPWDRPHCNEHL